MFVIADGVALIMLIGVSFIPESPRFLVLQLIRMGSGKAYEEIQVKTITALQFFKQASAQEVEQEFEALMQDAKASLGVDLIGSEQQVLLGGAGTFKEMLAAFNYPRPLLVGCGLVFLQQITGQPSILYFATNIFKDAGFKSSAAQQSVIVGLVKLFATLFTVWRVERWGRRILLLIGISIMAIALVMLATSFLFWVCSDPNVSADQCKRSDMTLPRGWADTTLIGLLLYVIGYQVGFGPIAWLLISEIFPLNVRGSALSVATFVNFGSNIAVTLFQPLLMDAITPAGLFFIFLGLAIVSIAFVAILVPETKGLSLEEIEIQMRTGSTRKVT